MKSFDDYFNENFEDGLSSPSKYILKFTFEAGQQSKQAEVDELQDRIDEAIYDLQHIESAMWEEQVEYVLMILKGTCDE